MPKLHERFRVQVAENHAHQKNNLATHHHHKADYIALDANVEALADVKNHASHF